VRVVVASKFWYLRGGLERVMFSEIEGLETRGVDVAHFSTTHPLNVDSPWSEYFAPYLELGGSGNLGMRESVTAVARMFSNPTAARRFGALLDEFRPDVVHVHGIHRQISPSILFQCRQRGVPVVQSLHDAHHVCPADVLLRAGSVVCDPRRCKTYNYMPAITNRCVRGSAAASAVSAAETTFQRVRRAYERTVTRFIAPSRYLARVMELGGWTAVPIDVVPNGVAVPQVTERDPEGYFLVAGRLSPEKGVGFALAAASEAGADIVVAGDGPLAESLQAQHPAARFVGHVEADVLGRLLDGAIAAVVPSVAPENAPMSVMEAMSRGVPVIASKIGGIGELVDEESGILVAPGDTKDLASAMRVLAEESERAAAMGQRAVQRMRTEYTMERHVESLLEVYERSRSTGEGVR